MNLINGIQLNKIPKQDEPNQQESISGKRIKNEEYQIINNVEDKQTTNGLFKKYIQKSMKQKQNEQDKLTYNPDWIPDSSQEQQDELFLNANKHMMASAIGQKQKRNEKQENNDDFEKCHCCGRQIKRDSKPFYEYSPQDLSFIGVGYTLYFEFIKYCCFFLLIIILTAGSYSYLSNMQGSGCHLMKNSNDETESKCVLTPVTSTSLLNK